MDLADKKSGRLAVPTAPFVLGKLPLARVYGERTSTRLFWLSLSAWNVL